MATKTKSPAEARRGRIIVRNLPFSNLSEDAVKEVFAPYGNIEEVQLLRKPNGKFVGCGFVQFEHAFQAGKAIAKCNGYIMNGRPIVVDWSLPRQQYADKVNAENEEAEDDKDGILDYEIDNKPDVEIDTEGDEISDQESDGEDDDEDEDEEFESSDNENKSAENLKKSRPESRDVDEGKTVFLRNVAYTANNDDLKKCVEVYGPVVYALICVDKLTEHSKGTAFVKFKDKESAEKCLKASKKILLKDQMVEVTMAVTRSKLEEERTKQRLKTKDSRNLYLVREGVVMAGSPAATDVSSSDMAKRLQIELWKTQILRNFNMFVAKTRLAIHNLPFDYDDAQLRAMVEEHSLPTAVIKEARVMQDRKKFNAQGNAISKEIGFVTFTTHEDALHLLRAINNNPSVFTPNKRPIVSFSIENREILTLKSKRLEKSRAKVLGYKAKDKVLVKMNKKQRRFLRRKENLIKKRQEAKLLKNEEPNGKLVNASSGETAKKSKKTSKVQGKTVSKKLRKKLNLEKNGQINESVNGFNNKKPKEVGMKKKLKQQQTPEKQEKFAKMEKNSDLAKSKKLLKRKNETEEEEKPSKIQKTTDFSGTHADPGKKIQVRSSKKLAQQVEIFSSRKREVKKLKRMQKKNEDKMKIRREKGQNKMKKTKRRVVMDDNLDLMINKYKNNIQSAASYKKWHDT